MLEYNPSLRPLYIKTSRPVRLSVIIRAQSSGWHRPGLTFCSIITSITIVIGGYMITMFVCLSLCPPRKMMLPRYLEKFLTNFDAIWHDGVECSKEGCIYGKKYKRD